MSRPDLEEERYLGLDAEFADLPLQRLWCRHVQRLPLRNSEPDVRPVRRLMRRHHSPASRPYETDPRDAQKYSSRRAHRAISAVGCKSPKRRAPTSRYGRQRGFGRETPLPVGDSGIGCAHGGPVRTQLREQLRGPRGTLPGPGWRDVKRFARVRQSSYVEPETASCASTCPAFGNLSPPSAPTERHDDDRRMLTGRRRFTPPT